MMMRIRRGVVLGTVFLAAVISGVLCGGAAAGPDGKKIGLSILYVGHPGSEREKDFTTFLEQEFERVGTADLAGFKGNGDGFDVLVMDHDAEVFKAPQPDLSPDYSRPTVAIAVAGAMICDRRQLKTGYL
jgi:hypothetical protein